jgi:putative membrane protein
MAQSKLPGVLVALTLLGCAKADTPPAAEYPKQSPALAEEARTPPPTETPAVGDPLPLEVPMEPAARARLTDTQIVKITDTVNGGEVEQAKVAKERAKNPAVKKFAAMMITQHTQAKEQGLKLSKQTKLEPLDSAVADDLASKGAKTLDALKAADAESFDRTYIESQVKQHQEVLDELDSHLIPEATTPKLKAELEKARVMVEGHLTKAKQIQSEL